MLVPDAQRGRRAVPVDAGGEAVTARADEVGGGGGSSGRAKARRIMRRWTRPRSRRRSDCGRRRRARRSGPCQQEALVRVQQRGAGQKPEQGERTGDGAEQPHHRNRIELISRDRQSMSPDPSANSQVRYRLCSNPMISETFFATSPTYHTQIVSESNTVRYRYCTLPRTLTQYLILYNKVRSDVEFNRRKILNSEKVLPWYCTYSYNIDLYTR